ncbi:MAG: hypothetical protein AAF226_17105, partial [Verrucomicrobiota bacterium]
MNNDSGQSGHSATSAGAHENISTDLEIVLSAPVADEPTSLKEDGFNHLLKGANFNDEELLKLLKMVIPPEELEGTAEALGVPIVVGTAERIQGNSIKASLGQRGQADVGFDNAQLAVDAEVTESSDIKSTDNSRQDSAQDLSTSEEEAESQESAPEEEIPKVKSSFPTVDPAQSNISPSGNSLMRESETEDSPRGGGFSESAPSIEPIASTPATGGLTPIDPVDPILIYPPVRKILTTAADSATTREGSSVTIDALANDNTTDGNLDLVSVGPTPHGSVSVAG